MTVIGIDLSLTQTGLAVAEAGRIVWTGVVKTKAIPEASIGDWSLRLEDIVNQIRGVVDRTGPTLAALEAPSFGSLNGAQHERGGLWWGTVRMLRIRGLDMVKIAPKARTKYATGNGNSDKREVHAYVQKRYGRDDLPIKSNDEADAVILAAMGARYLGVPVEVEPIFPPCLEAMAKVAR